MMIKNSNINDSYEKLSVKYINKSFVPFNMFIKKLFYKSILIFIRVLSLMPKSSASPSHERTKKKK